MRSPPSKEKRSKTMFWERFDYATGPGGQSIHLKQELNISGCSAVGSARALGARCRRFESCHSDQKRGLVSLRSSPCSVLCQIPVFDVCLWHTESCFACGECCIPTTNEDLSHGETVPLCYELHALRASHLCTKFSNRREQKNGYTRFGCMPPAEN